MSKRSQITTSVVFTIAALTCTALCLSILLGPGNGTSGILSVEFDLPELTSRSFQHADKADGGLPRRDILNSVQSRLQSAASVAATAVPNAVSSAIEEAEAAVAALAPRNCTLGTSHLCLGFSNRTDCWPFPLDGSDLVVATLSGLPAEHVQPLSRSLEDFGRIISAVATQDFSKYFACGAALTGLAVVLGLIFLSSLWYKALSLPCQISGFAIPTIAVLRASCNIVCVVVLLIPGIYMHILLSKCEELPFDVIRGEVQGVNAAALGLAACMLTLTVVSWIIGRRSKS